MEPNSAHEIHDVLCANSVANLNYSTAIIYPDTKRKSVNPLEWLYPFSLQTPSQKFIEFYNTDELLKTAPLPIPFFLEKFQTKILNPSHAIYKYYLPYHVFPVTEIIHTRDWNCVKAAIKAQIPVIYECHYFQDKPFEPEIVNSPFFKLAITQAELIRESVIQTGMPPEKSVWLHNGFSQSFLNRHLEDAQKWRNELLKNGRQSLVVYSGALYPFKGVNLLIDVAKILSDIQFVVTGGTEEQVNSYRKIAQDKQVKNINFLGWILPFSRVNSLLQAADVLAHPHCSGKSANFTNPLKFFQYMASGTPIAITEIPPLMEFRNTPIISGWCEPDNPHSFADCLQWVIKNYPRKAEGYKENIEFSSQYTYEGRAAKILSYINL
ncbi:glycosyltransferase family 4 protein [Aphanothece hegewaldii]|nr:glycosyltransferase [Aphanothece hegewaldii]